MTFARYTVQVALQYEFDAREIPSNFSTGYLPQGAFSPNQYPQNIYGTEVFEVNTALRKVAARFARKAKLSDSKDAIAYRKHYAKTPAYLPGSKPPSVVLCDSATSDVYYSGKLLSEALGNYSTLVTNGSAVYCTTAQEDNATLEALIRGALVGLVDFSRIILLRTASDFDRPFKGEEAITNLLYAAQGGFPPAIENIYLAGVKVVEGIVNGWDRRFAKGVPAKNYIGDIFGSLPQAAKPDFGLPSQFIPDQIVARGEGVVLGRQGLHVRRSGGKPILPMMRVGAPKDV